MTLLGGAESESCGCSRRKSRAGSYSAYCEQKDGGPKTSKRSEEPRNQINVQKYYPNIS